MELTGALLVDKPRGPTSHDVVAFARRLLKTSRIGHTGTLDPLATGLLVLLVGPATRLAQFLAGDGKEYIADVRLGVATPTYDAQSLAEGVRCPTPDIRYPRPAELDAVLDRFRGSFLQTPPAYSAKKVAGVAAYEKARRNQPLDLKPVEVTVHQLERLPVPDTDRTLVRLRVAASAGFYVRSLAHDLGQALGCGAHLEALRRTRAGGFAVENAAPLDVLQAEGADAAARMLSVNTLLAAFPAVTLTSEGLRRAANGNPLAPEHQKGGCPLFRADPGSSVTETSDFRAIGHRTPPEKGTAPFFRVLDADGEVLAVAAARTDGLLHPVVVLR